MLVRSLALILALAATVHAQATQPAKPFEVKLLDYKDKEPSVSVAGSMLIAATTKVPNYDIFDLVTGQRVGSASGNSTETPGLSLTEAVYLDAGGLKFYSLADKAERALDLGGVMASNLTMDEAGNTAFAAMPRDNTRAGKNDYDLYIIPAKSDKLPVPVATGPGCYDEFSFGGGTMVFKRPNKAKPALKELAVLRAGEKEARTIDATLKPNVTVFQYANDATRVVWTEAEKLIVYDLAKKTSRSFPFKLHMSHSVQNAEVRIAGQWVVMADWTELMVIDLQSGQIKRVPTYTFPNKLSMSEQYVAWTNRQRKKTDPQPPYSVSYFALPPAK